ncbi:hypothetical protein PG993_003208 [Apiospora rasikravindrae]|uniref:Uncharacterized protein n=1 Tax=Apiospora rasikravindrae TaxID=990691 RepID=A0ABR1TYU3_9PEZI
MATDNPNTIQPPADQPNRFDDDDPENLTPTSSRKMQTAGQVDIEDKKTELLRDARNEARFYIELLAHLVTVLYHVDCFEKVADLSNAAFVDRLRPMTRSFADGRLQRMAWPIGEPNRIHGPSIKGGKFDLDGGATRLIDYWLKSVRSQIASREGQSEEHVNPHLSDNHSMSGSSYTSLPIPEDKEDWNLLMMYVPCKFDNPNGLSSMLDEWCAVKKVVLGTPDCLTDKDKNLRLKIGKRGAEAVARLSRRGA